RLIGPSAGRVDEQHGATLLAISNRLGNQSRTHIIRSSVGRNAHQVKKVGLFQGKKSSLSPFRARAEESSVIQRGAVPTADGFHGVWFFLGRTAYKNEGF